MKFDPITKEIFTDKNEFVKKLNCPYRMTWSNLEDTNSQFRKCSVCEKVIIDTNILTDDELVEIVKQDPNTCLKVDLNQNNLTVKAYGNSGTL